MVCLAVCISFLRALVGVQAGVVSLLEGKPNNLTNARDRRAPARRRNRVGNNSARPDICCTQMAN